MSTSRSIQWILRAGLLLALGLMVTGAVIKFASGDMAVHPVGLLEWRHSALPWGERLMTLGILVLALTPVFRVLALIGLWAEEKDWRFVGVACAVLVTLLVALVSGRG